MNVSEVIERARSQAGRSIQYRMGGGSVRASRHSCADAANRCDCSAFVCWSLGLDKVGNYPWLLAPGEPRDPGGEWYGTDSIVNDALNAKVGFFSRLATPLVGAVVVYPTRWQSGKARPAGHCGIVTELANDGTAHRVIHCSSGNFKRTGDAVQETDSSVFDNNPHSIYAWYSGTEITGATNSGKLKATLEAFQLPVSFCIVAKGSARATIEPLARQLAALNPVGRRVLVPEDDAFPDAASISEWTHNDPSAGAVVLRPSGALYEVLTIDQASRGAYIEDAFANGRL